MLTVKPISLAKRIAVPLEFLLELKNEVYCLPLTSLIAFLRVKSPLTPLELTNLVSDRKITSVFRFLMAVTLRSKLDFRPVRLRELTFWDEKLISMSCLTTPTVLISEGIKITVMWRGGGLCSRGGIEKKSTLRIISEKSRAVVVQSIDGGSCVVFSGLCSL